MNGFFITINNGLLETKHYLAMKESVWLFMWLLDKMTSISEDGVGKILGGRPITSKEVTEDIGISDKTYRRYMDQLKKHNYINVDRASHGLIITVNKAQKIYAQKNIKADRSKMTDGESDRSDLSKSSVTNGRSIYRQDKDTSTNVLEEKVSSDVKTPIKKKTFGDPDLNDGMALLKELYPHVTRIALNRFALRRLIKNKTFDRTIKAIRYAHKMRDERYCPTITNYLDLEQKWDKLESFARKQAKQHKPVAFELSAGFIERN